MIEDCTHTYNAFQQLEAALRAELGDYDKAMEMRGAFDGADQGLQKVLTERLGMSGTETYAEVIGRVAAACKQGPVLELFPFIIDGKKIWTDRPDKAEWSREMFEFAGSLDILRKMRNDISHPKAINEKEFQSTLQTAKRLIAWIDQAGRKSSGEQPQQAS